MLSKSGEHPRHTRDCVQKFEFQRMTEDRLRDLDRADPFVDDIVVSSGTPEMTDEELI